MSYTYKYPRPMVTVDILLLRYSGDDLEVLFIRRDRPPFQGKWAFPGGFVEIEESLEAAARRELEEETGLSGIPLQQLWTAGDPGRDPRGRTISVLFAGMLAPPFANPRAGDDARAAAWFPLREPPPLAFDHTQLLARAKELLQECCFWRLQALLLLEPRFQLSRFRSLGAALWGSELYADKLRQVAEQLGWVIPAKEGYYQRKASPEEIIHISPSRLLTAWANSW